ncbi:hypothetical protein COHA_004306 [Chlorella ohadii]|uniref:Nicotinamide-nucleotide adenylyltransferase n=1 Tax=Chlorella ohadii TaxID=2649997 RepID=A0AAD5DQY3_9CHLO|nr:hypothetical protein COHA_004306 [Chlorella ohadii]
MPLPIICRHMATASSSAAAGGRSRASLAAALLLVGSAGGAGVALCLSPHEAAVLQGAGGTSEPKEPDLWDRWASVKAFLGSWRRGPPPSEVPLPVDKLKCHLQPGGYSLERYHPAVLVLCGSFNPPTFMHLRMLELAQQALAKSGFDVLGCYMSPVNDAYWKAALAGGRHRVRMCQLATADSDSIMVDSWEVEQRQYTRTLFVLQRVERELGALFSAGTTPAPAEPAAGACPPTPPRVVLVCGADVLHSMADPTLWRQDLLETLLRNHGVVCISRTGSDTARLLDKPGTLLNTYRRNVTVVEEPVPNEISSSRVRHELERGHSVRYLLPDAVARYIYSHGLYNTAQQRPRLLHLGDQKRRSPIYVMDPTLGILVDAWDLATPPIMHDPCCD